VCVFQPVVAAVGDPFYKITSEALLVCQQLVIVIRPLGQYYTGIQHVSMYTGWRIRNGSYVFYIDQAIGQLWK